jgi:hypothetical protein
MATNIDQYTDLSLEIRSALPTNDAAFHLNRKPQAQ